MKMNYFKCIILLLLMISCKGSEKQLKEKEFLLNGQVSGMETGNLYVHEYSQGTSSVDSIKVENGSFTLEGQIDTKVKKINLSPNKQIRTSDDPYVELYLEPGVMNLDLDLANLQDATLSGSKTMDQSYALRESMNQLKQKYSKELAAFEANWEQIRKATTEEEKKELKWKDDDLRNDLQPYYEEISEVQKKFVIDNPESFISFQHFPFVLNDLTQEEARAIYEKFPQEYKTPEMAERLEREIEDMSKGIPGAVAGDFNTVDINGEPVKLADFKGQYLLIDFWASWCVPCRKGNPHLLDLYAKYKPKGLEILGVSDDDSNPEAWRKAVKEDEIGVWRHVLRGMKVDRSGGGFKLLEGGISGRYNISTLPTKVLVNPEGIVVGRYGGGGGTDEDMDRDLAEIFDLKK